MQFMSRSVRWYSSHGDGKSSITFRTKTFYEVKAVYEIDFFIFKQSHRKTDEI